MKFFLKTISFTLMITCAMFLLPIAQSHQSLLIQDPLLEESSPREDNTLSQRLYELNGRGAGTAQEKAAAEILAGYFAEIGLEPWPEHPTYLQEFLIGSVDSFKEGGRTRFRSSGPLKSQSQNVIGYLPGQDPDGKWIVFGAHYDGQGEVAGLIYPSANDNLSGIMALTALAKSLAEEARVNYTLVFIAFGAEEPGLLGSSYLIENLPVPPEKIQAVINLDTIGRTCDALFVYSAEPNALASLLAPLFDRYGFKTSIIITPGISDHYPFSLYGIPSVTVATANWREGNHTPEDTLDKLDRHQIGSIAGVLKHSLHYLVR